MSVVLGLTTTRHFVYKLRPRKNGSNSTARRRGRIAPRLVSVSAECRLNSPPPLDRLVLQRVAVSCQTSLPPAQGRWRAVPGLTTEDPTDLVSVDAGLTTTRHFVYKLRPRKNGSNSPARQRGRITPRLVSVSAECRLNSPPPLDRLVFQRVGLVVKRAFHRHKAGGGQFRV